MEAAVLRNPPRVPRRILVIDDEERMARSIRTLLEEQDFQVEIAFSGASGLARLAEWNAPVVITDLRMSDGDGFEVMQALADRPGTAFIVITAHATTESAIEAVQRHAFDFVIKPFEFEVLLSAVERAFTKLETERFRDDMISMITHDVKIPLTSILGYSSMVFNRTTGEPHPRAREFVETIRANGHKILSLLDNFLTSVKIEAGHLSLYFRDINVHAVLEDLLSAFQAELDRAKLLVERDFAADPALIKADESQLYRAICNVVSNAIKFTPPRGVVRIRTSLLTASESPLTIDTFKIAVENTGPGIAPDDLPHILEKYQRGAAHRGIEGSGIGSYVLRYVVEAHGGKVLVDSVPNDLTTFTLLLPISQTRPPEEDRSF